MNFHWMSRNEDTDLRYLKTLSYVLESSGYKSVMFVYDPLNSDYWIKIAHILDPEQKLKYMFAIRTYAISPEYCAMMCEAFNEISPNRLMLNIIAGDKSQMKNEKRIDGLVEMDHLLNDSLSRIDYTEKFLEKFIKLRLPWEKPELAIAGTSDKTLDNAAKYGDYNLCMYDSFMAEPERYMRNKKRMLSAECVVTDTEEEAERLTKEMESIDNGPKFTIYGTPDQLKKKFIDLEKIGVTDLMFSKNQKDNNVYRVHNLVKEILEMV